jgi:glycosyltransferase involved in cell wall biosynthesis
VDSEELVISQRLRILHITKRFWPNTGGVERYVEDLAQQQLLRGHIPMILTPDRDLVTGLGGRLPTTEYYRGLRIERVPAVGNARKQVPVGGLGTIFRALRWADVVHHHDPRFLFETTVLARRLMRFRLLFHTHGLILHTDAYQRLKRGLLAVYYGPVLRHLVDGVIADSEGDLALLKRAAGVSGRRVHLIPNAIDLTEFLEIQPAPAGQTLLAFGRVDRHKGLGSLLRSLAPLAGGWRLVVAGSGPPQLIHELRSLADELGIASRVSWEGQVSDVALRSLLAQASLVLFPSEFEGFGLALLEAMAASRPVIASAIPTHAEVLGPGLAELLVNFDDGAATNAIASLLAAPADEREALGARARERSLAFDLPRLVDQVEELYQALGISPSGPRDLPPHVADRPPSPPE